MSKTEYFEKLAALEEKEYQGYNIDKARLKLDQAFENSQQFNPYCDSIDGYTDGLY